MKKISVLLAFLCLLTAASSLAEGLPVVFQRDGFTKPDVPVEWVDESPFAGIDEDDLLQVDFLGIRQGDCIIISYKGKHMLVDGGETFRYVGVEKYLMEKEITYIDYFLLTHAHDDHVGVQRALFRHFFGPDIQYSPYDPDEKYECWTPYSAQLQENDIEMIRLQTGDVIDIAGDVTLSVYRWPRTSASLMNSHSLVTMVRFGDARMLLTGDIDGDTQNWLLENFDPGEFKCDIMKAPHHGNNILQKAFAEAVSPSLVVVTNPSGSTKKLNAQLDKLKIPRLHIPCTVHCQTDGKIWYVWREKMPD